MTKKEFFISRIDKIAKENFNSNQKEIAKKIIKNTNDEDLDSVWGLISQRVKTGFVFDNAPETNNDCVSYLKENENLGINLNKENTLEHQLIIGENYDALKNLLIAFTNNQGKGLIDIIYIDPPYNTDKSKEEGCNYVSEDFNKKNKFIYRDKYTRDGWLNMMNERLKLARRILKDDGIIFISIDDNEQAYLKVLCDEIFGEENFYGQFIQLKGNTQNDSKSIQHNHEYILCYAKKSNPLLLTYHSLVKKEVFEDSFFESNLNGATGNHNKLIERNNLGYSIYYFESNLNNDLDNNKLIEKINYFSKKYGNYKYFIKNNKFIHAIAVLDYSIENLKDDSLEEEIYTNIKELLDADYKIIRPPKRSGNKLGRWTWGIETFKEYWNNDEILVKNFKNIIKKQFVKIENTIIEKNKRYFIQDNIIPLQSIIDITNSKGTTLLKSKNGIIPGCNFQNPKSIELLKYLIKSYKLDSNSKSLTILDFFAGSGTTGQAVMELNEEDGGNRKFILVTNNENNIATNITRERLFRVINGKGSKNENFEWCYSKDKKCLNKNSIRVFDIVKQELNITDFEKAEKIAVLANESFKKLNNDFENKNNLNIYNALASLTPYKEKSEA